jgi:bacterioferritin (cytochrome b1)
MQEHNQEKRKMRRLAEIDRLKLVEILRERLFFEERSARLHEVVIARLAPEEPAIRRVVPRLEQHRDQERAHADWLRVQLQRLEAAPEPAPPSRAVVEELGALERLIADRAASVTEVLQALLSAEHDDHDAWEILVELAERAGDQPAREDFADRRAVEEVHVAYLKRLVTDLARNHVLGTPVTLPLDVE